MDGGWVGGEFVSVGVNDGACERCKFGFDDAVNASAVIDNPVIAETCLGFGRLVVGVVSVCPSGVVVDGFADGL